MNFCLHGSVRTVGEAVDRAQRAEALGFEAIFPRASTLLLLGALVVIPAHAGIQVILYRLDFASPPAIAGVARNDN